MVSFVDWAAVDPLLTMLAGANAQVDPLGRPAHWKDTVPVKPLDEIMESVTSVL